MSTLLVSPPRESTPMPRPEKKDTHLRPAEEYVRMKMEADIDSEPPHTEDFDNEGEEESEPRNVSVFNADINAFFAATPNIQLLTQEEEQRLLHQAVGGDTEAAKKIVYHNLRFIIKRAKSLVKKHQSSKQNGTVDNSLFLEAISEGCIGMFRAIETFDPAKKCKLITFAAWHIDERIRRIILFDVNSAKPAKSLSQVKHSKSTLIPISSIESFDHQDSKTASILDAVSADIQNELLAGALKKLGFVERFIVTNRYGFFDQSYTPSQLAEMLGTSTARIKKLETVALKKLWLFMNKDKIGVATHPAVVPPVTEAE